MVGDLFYFIRPLGSGLASVTVFGRIARAVAGANARSMGRARGGSNV